MNDPRILVQYDDPGGGAYGLSGDDIRALLDLVRTDPPQRITVLRSIRDDAEVDLGVIDNAGYGVGRCLLCARSEQGWALKESCAWPLLKLGNTSKPIWLGAEVGLPEDDILQLHALIRTQTDEKILAITSLGKRAEVQTGFSAGGECGSGQCFECIRNETGWSIRSESSWIA